MEANNSKIGDQFPPGTLPSNLNNHGTAMKLILILDSAHVCHGYPKREYVEMASSCKGVFRGKSGEVRAQIDSTNPVIMQGKVYQTTIRTVGCALLSNSPLCDQCKKYGPVLRATFSRCRNTQNEVSKFTNNRFLTSPQKCTKLKQLQKKVVSEQKQKNALLERIQHLTSSSGIEVEPSFHNV